MTDQLRCPLPVVRKHYIEAEDRYDIVFGRCDEDLFVDVEESLYIDGSETCGKNWKVTCLGGHVLLVPDHGGDDNYTLIPWRSTYPMQLRSLFAGLGFGDMALADNERTDG